MKKITISTTHKGFNYGTSLQAYASKLYLTNLGYNAELIWHKEFFFKGRDIRLRKIIIMFLRTFWRPKLFVKTYLTYKKSLKKEITKDTKTKFLKFASEKLQVQRFSWKELKEYAYKDEVLACICGSDQIWNATNIYMDPIYYLKFAPREKRVAYAPSLGKNEIPPYNKEIIKKNISEFDYLSIREEQGANIIKELIGKEVPVLIDPTLLLDKVDWLNTITDFKGFKNEKYILLYFLDAPSFAAIKYIEHLLELYKCKAICIPNYYSEFDNFKDCSNVSAGPLEFIDLIANTQFVCTDSFHGTAFSINFNIPFFAFNRTYGIAADQSSRIVSLLKKLQLQDRFISETELNEDINFEETLSFENSNKLLAIEREKSKTYLLNSFSKIESKRKHGGNNEK